jgi:hypothetical protein
MVMVMVIVVAIIVPIPMMGVTAMKVSIVHPAISQAILREQVSLVTVTIDANTSVATIVVLLYVYVLRRAYIVTGIAVPAVSVIVVTNTLSVSIGSVESAIPVAVTNAVLVTGVASLADLG